MSTTRREFLLRTGIAIGAPLISCRETSPPSSGADNDERTSTMSIQFSSVLHTEGQGRGGPFSVESLDLQGLGRRVSPVVGFDDFHVSRSPFGPHPHAGFSAITYVFRDSPGGLRNRDSLGGHVVVGPGGICWLQAGRGAMHEELPADSGKELHGLQLFVNLSAKNKLVEPKTLSLVSDEVPAWRSSNGDVVKVAVGSFGGISSPLIPVEAFTLLDIELHREVDFKLAADHNALIYVRRGDVTIEADGRKQRLATGQGLAAFGGAGTIKLTTTSPADVILLSGAEIDEPVVAQGPFIMNSASQIQEAAQRFRAGRMGSLAPYSAT